MIALQPFHLWRVCISGSTSDEDVLLFFILTDRSWSLWGVCRRMCPAEESEYELYTIPGAGGLSMVSATVFAILLETDDQGRYIPDEVHIDDTLGLSKNR